MGQLLDWYSKYNSFIIQSLSVVIGGLLVFFIFRLFFSKGNQAQSAGSLDSNSANMNSDQIETKVQQILAEQKQKKIESNDPSVRSGADNSEVIDKLQTEIFNLKQTIKENDSKEKSMTQQTAADVAAVSKDSMDVSGYQKEIDDLKNRLSDYEVIAEDISDLQKLREENKNLLAQLATQKSLTPISNQIADKDVQNLIQDLTDDLVVTDEPEVTADEKDLLQQFEKVKG